ncbi:hypothetical protein QO010_002791 [Caulobacter ginsengisoli]|uniref:Uncharacterized protein n=1 Tax=Caulobacter ginsengisoli TaxID=400775 RepID=A0ABU0ISM7_9CAUL|nr:hypothetical protein [Caulobacter ginsengisoli]MDQ0465007.1 hypothetical protein [Caulobacter ginsengisoli]
MRWVRTDPVQTVGAVLVRGPGAVEGLNRAMAGKPAALRSLPFARGEDWAALFARPDGENEPVLPRLAGAVPLYEALPGWWLPVGWALAAPDHVQPVLWQAIGEHYGLAPPAIVVPREEGDEADLYLVRHLAPFAREAAA